VPTLATIDLKKQLQVTSDEFEKLKTSMSEKDEEALRTKNILDDLKRQLAEAEGMNKYRLLSSEITFQVKANTNCENHRCQEQAQRNHRGTGKK
jgi:hypothetical protein